MPLLYSLCKSSGVLLWRFTHYREIIIPFEFFCIFLYYE
nr:MAG TPA: hypothetical protein [Herelleviridae sp.]